MKQLLDYHRKHEIDTLNYEPLYNPPIHIHLHYYGVQYLYTTLRSLIALRYFIFYIRWLPSILFLTLLVARGCSQPPLGKLFIVLTLATHGLIVPAQLRRLLEV